MNYIVEGYAIARDQDWARVADYVFEAKPWLDQASESKIGELRAGNYSGDIALEVYHWVMKRNPDMQKWHNEMMDQRNRIHVVIHHHDAERFTRHRLHVLDVANTAVNDLIGDEQ